MVYQHEGKWLSGQEKKRKMLGLAKPKKRIAGKVSTPKRKRKEEEEKGGKPEEG